MGAQIISVANHKGGTGKTTTTLNLGCALAALGKKVLLVDLDPQANLTYALGITQPKSDISEIIAGGNTIASAVVNTENVNVLPGSPEMSDIELSMAAQQNRAYMLKEHLDTVKKKYDYILIDAPPSLSLLTINALTASSGVLIPMQLEVLTLQGLSQMLGTIDKVRNTYNAGLTIKGIVLVMYDKRRKLTEELQNIISENFESKIYSSHIRLNVKIAEAPSFGQAVISYDPSSTGAADYMSLAREFLKD